MSFVQKGDVVLDLRPSVGNPRNSEGAFLALSDGRILFVYSRFTGDSYHDYATASLSARFSEDEGETWLADVVIATPAEHRAVNIMSVSLLRMSNGDIGLFYIIRYGWHNTRLHLCRSADEGRTWGEAHCCIPGFGYYVTNNDRVIRLSGGRLLVPAAYHRMIGESLDEISSWDSRGSAFFFYSDNDGDTWKEAKNFCTLEAPHSRSGLQEPGVVELGNGVIWAWARTDMGRQYEMFSKDQGETWSPAVPSAFTSPNSPLSMKRMPGSGCLLAVWNPAPDYPTRKSPGHSWGRTPMIGAVSADDGKSWEKHFAIETEEDRGGYCYTAIHFVTEAVLLAYCAGEPEDGICLARVKIRKIRLDDIMN